ncbi:hypothetical protein [Ruegeria arenilitoris]|uniref:hypothetical protein n=1 Tax=Ruegeria arenilitoris TaxID=1173585 RepID=UPI00147B4CF2|nr:hypothetical protein [Ruegeria arenilitoris]
MPAKEEEQPLMKYRHRIEYDLTPTGRSLILPLHTLWEWAAEKREDIDNSRAAYDQRVAAKTQST